MPSLNFLKSASSAITIFEIRPDDSTVILSGDPRKEVILRGKLVLCLNKPLEFRKIKLEFKCDTRIAFPRHEGPEPGHDWVDQRRPWSEAVLWTLPPEKKEEDQSGPKGKGYSGLEGKHHSFTTLPIDNHTWDFGVKLGGDDPESVEGLLASWINWRLKATIEFGKRFEKDYTIVKHIRVIKTRDLESFELSPDLRRSNTWNDVIQYTVRTPSQAVIFGTRVQVDFRLIPLMKGLVIGDMKCKLVESQKMTRDALPPGTWNREHTFERTICEETWRLPEGTETEDIDGQDGYRHTGFLPLPKSLRECVQSVEDCGIKVVHKITYSVEFQKPSGSQCLIEGEFNINIFLSPALPDLRTQTSQTTGTAETTQAVVERVLQGPPAYGDHHQSQLLERGELYRGVNVEAYQTPAGGSTPFSNRSRSNSQADPEELVDTTASREVAANTLHNRLASLSTNDSTTTTSTSSSTTLRAHPVTPPQIGPFPSSTEGICNPDCSSPQHRQRRTTDLRTPRHIENGIEVPHAPTPVEPIAGPSRPPRPIQLLSRPSRPPRPNEELSRLPSYTTASRITAVHTPPAQNGLPTYDAATSRPTTPSSPVSPTGAAQTESPGPMRRSRSDRALHALGEMLRPLQRRQSRD